MATRSRPPSQARSPINQGELGPFIPPASPELGKTVDVVKDGLAQLQSAQGPHTPEEQKPPAVEETPRAAPKAKPIGKAQPFLGAPAPIISTGAPRRNPLSLFNPYPSLSFPSGPAPTSQGPPPAPIVTLAQPPAPSTVKVDHPDAFKGKIGSEAKQWLTQMLAWVRLNQRQFPTDLEVLSFLLMNMEEAAGAWAHPHLDQLGSHCALIQTMDEFKNKFLAAFGDPDATRAAERKITSLTQTGTCAKYITKFRTLQMELDWNDAALCGQFAQGLHWEVQKQIATRERQPRTLRELQDAALIIDNALREEQASHLQQGNKSGRTSSTPNWGQVPANRPPKPAPSPPTPTTSRKERNRRRAEGLCVKCGKPGHKFAKCWTRWKATPKEDKGKAKETAKTGKDSEYQSGKEITPLFTIPIKPEKQAETLEVLIDSGATSSFLHPRTAELLRLPLIDLPTPRSHAAILGLKWLDAHNPDIDWNTRTLSFPHTTPERVAIAEEEEADKNPLKGVPSEYHQYAKVFGEEEFNKLPPHRHYDIGIELTKEGPLNSPLYSMTDAESATLKDWLRDKLKAGKICPSKSSISSPVMFVPKKDGSRRLVVDYCRLNNWTKKNVYPLPCPDDLMAQLRGAKIFTKLDLRWGYNNVRVKEGDEWKTAFRTKYGLYKSLVMTFGLTNAPAAFQHFMNKLFKDLLDICVIIYLDDILIYSKDDATHTKHVHEVLKRLMDNQLFCKVSKCTFHVTSVEYLGIIVLDKGFSLDKLKIQAVQEWPVPQKSKNHMARPLHNLVKKDTPWKWDTREQEAFQGLKDAITNAPVLCHADPTKPYFLETDASGAALGSILSQQQEDGRLHPLGFLSNHSKVPNKTMTPMTRNSSQSSGHLSIGESRTFNRQHAQWHLLLAGYNFQIVYCPGKQSGKPDALSRQSDHADIPPAVQTMLPDPVFANIALVTPEKELQRQIKASLDQDESLEEILQFLQNKSKAPPSIKRAFKDYKMEAGLLFYQGQIVVPDVGTLRTDLLHIFHNSPLAGHPGRQRTLELVSRNYYWPGIRADTYWHVDSCETCQRIRKPKYASIPPQPLELPVRPWQHVSYDMIVDLPKDGSNDSILVIVDSFTNGIIPGTRVETARMPKKRSQTGEGSYHPQSNGQTERVNPSIKHFLRAYLGVNQRDWTRWLPMAEFAYNNAVHSSTGKTPFKALYGWEPTLTPSNVPTDVPEADELAKTMEAQWKEVELALRQPSNG
ncbi:hypothetical protein RHS01_10770 [Rhizoctonia solani]|uniref:Uncharacterized protein n=1 Tax=Rhizoctonia solani TaxID=456999 RepID=A0A8H7LZT1_9AGAM|nr:hypothetical protein RHS01_10770 [Rhizoctonia solani]